jgi:polysaccharide biosynthesis/export protein
MKKSKLLAVMLPMAIPAMVAYGQNASVRPRPDTKLVAAKDGTATTSSANDVTVKRATDDPNYVIGPNDELIVSVWKEPEVSRTVPVRPDGKISLALLNDVQAQGLTPMQLGSDITEKLKKFMADPQVTVIVTKINSQQIFIVGEVLKSGGYALLPNMTALDAISNAGGFTPFAKRTKIYILRTENGKATSIPFNYKEAVRSHRPEQDIVLKPGDKIVVP